MQYMPSFSFILLTISEKKNFEYFFEYLPNQSSNPTEIKNITFVEGNVLSKYAKFRFHPAYGFWEEDF